MIPVETVPGIRGVGMKESSGGGEFKYDIWYIIRTFVNATMYRHSAIKNFNKRIVFINYYKLYSNKNDIECAWFYQYLRLYVPDYIY
jgi:hypothetical protein